MSKFELMLRNRLHITLRGCFEFLVVAAALILAEPTPTSMLIGSLVSVVGQIFRIWSAGYVRKPADALLVVGPYRFVRHPRYLGTFLLLLGLAIASRSVYVLGFLLLGVTMIYYRNLRQEEERLAKLVGPAFASYRASVSSFVPQLFPAAPGSKDKSVFSIGYAVLEKKNRELESLLAMALGFAFLYITMRLETRIMMQGIIGTMLVVFVVFRFIYYSRERTTATSDSYRR